MSLADSVPFGSLAADRANLRVSSSNGEDVQVQSAVFRPWIGANYFATLGISLLAGREFDRRNQLWGR